MNISKYNLEGNNYYFLSLKSREISSFLFKIAFKYNEIIEKIIKYLEEENVHFMNLDTEDAKILKNYFNKSNNHIESYFELLKTFAFHSLNRDSSINQLYEKRFKEYSKMLKDINYDINKKINLYQTEIKNTFVIGNLESGVLSISRYMAKLIDRIVYTDGNGNYYNFNDVEYKNGKYVLKKDDKIELNPIKHKEVPSDKKLFVNDYYNNSKKIWINITNRPIQSNKITLLFTSGYSAMYSIENFIYSIALLMNLKKMLKSSNYDIDLIIGLGGFYDNNCVFFYIKDIFNIDEKNGYSFFYEPIIIRNFYFILLSYMYMELSNAIPLSLGYPLFQNSLDNSTSNEFELEIMKYVSKKEETNILLLEKVTSLDDTVDYLFKLYNYISNYNIINQVVDIKKLSYSYVVDVAVKNNLVDASLYNTLIKLDDLIKLT